MKNSLNILLTGVAILIISMFVSLINIIIATILGFIGMIIIIYAIYYLINHE